MRTSLSKRYFFKSVHTVPGEVDSAGNPLVHGHDYGLVVTLAGPEARERAALQPWIFSRDRLDQILKSEVLEWVHNKNLDLSIQPATGEIICQEIFARLLKTELEPYLHKIELEETKKNTFTVKRKIG